MNHCGTKTLNTDRLVLRQFTPDDAQAMFNNWAKDPEVTRFLTWQPHENAEITRRLLQQWVEGYKDPKYYQWAICPKELGEPIGSISVVSMNDERDIVSIGYCIGRRWWHQGITSEAFAAVIKYLFEEVGVNRLEARHNVNNPNSGRVMKKCGLTCEGTLRQASTDNTGIMDLSVWSILRSEYEAMASRTNYQNRGPE